MRRGHSAAPLTSLYNRNNRLTVNYGKLTTTPLYDGGMRNIRPIMQAVVTVSVLAVSGYAILSPYAPVEAQKWAQGAILLLTGFWLRGR